jgi:hypothetical protein
VTITVLDTYSAMTGVLRAADRVRALREMLEPVSGMYRYFPGEVDLVDMHLRSSGFPVDRDEDRCLAALEAPAEADAWGRMQRALDDALHVQLAATPGLEAPDIELNHNLRYRPGGVVWSPMTVTVGEHVVSEGLADAFARQLYGDLGHTRIGVPHLSDDAVFDKVVTGLDVTGMRNFTAWVHGDASARRHGADPVGLPTGAGYAAGNRLVDTYLAATGRTAAEAVHVPSAEIIAAALGTRPGHRTTS